MTSNKKEVAVLLKHPWIEITCIEEDNGSLTLGHEAIDLSYTCGACINVMTEDETYGKPYIQFDVLPSKKTWRILFCCDGCRDDVAFTFI